MGTVKDSYLALFDGWSEQPIFKLMESSADSYLSDSHHKVNIDMDMDMFKKKLKDLEDCRPTNFTRPNLSELFLTSKTTTGSTGSGSCGSTPGNRQAYFDGKNWVFRDGPAKDNCNECTDCKCPTEKTEEQKPVCMECKHVSLMSGVCTKGETKPTKECFEKA